MIVVNIAHPLTQIVATIIYGILGAAGYLMFGHAISDEVCQCHFLLLTVADESP